MARGGKERTGAAAESGTDSRVERGLSSPQQRKKRRVAEFFGAVECSNVAADWKFRAPLRTPVFRPAFLNPRWSLRGRKITDPSWQEFSCLWRIFLASVVAAKDRQRRRQSGATKVHLVVVDPGWWADFAQMSPA